MASVTVSTTRRSMRKPSTASPSITIETSRFGTREVSTDALLRIPDGLLGFEDIGEYCLLEHAPNSPFRWLQATTKPELAFVVTNPFDFFVEYDIEISDADADHLDLHKVEDAEVCVLLTFSPKGITANLVGPLVINHRNHLARQVVLNDLRYGTRHPILFANAN